MRNLIKLLALAGFTVIVGCASYVLTPGLVERSEPVSFRELLRNPGMYRGKTVILSGIILECRVVSDGTVCEILQVPAKPGSRPENADRSEGRFIARSQRFLDPAIYARGRQVTVGGVVSGEERKMVGEREYRYPVIDVEEIHLWPPEKEAPTYVCPSWCSDPWWCYRYWGPWWCWP
ncbi:Slp family lipoprotein [Thermodesulforhabdus norvegica]|uniref:Outer membrane lipoprotein n=1 Tax=Thermodesulforhabdus norvegica TaxID=39841 RepID=A0A1I4UYJ1_9BACT|nr:Slp family lipoprotein [Thermodesulforhabdus norvegica]SFM93840.1 outer membrane lipoprotein [Thermodesulforhabdus norvegica]